MLNKLFGKKEDVDLENKHSELAEHISKMGMAELRSLLLGQIERFKVDENTIIEILKRLTHEEHEKRFIEKDDNDIKLRKAFELVITAANSKKMSVEAVELIQKFITMYKDIIEDYDTRNQQIYMHKLTKAIELSIAMVEQISGFINKMAVIKEI